MKHEDEGQQLYIPEKLNVGFQNREGTYTGKLAYVIYYDKKGVLRKEKSWNSWRDSKIKPQEIDNVPTDGFVLNKKVGGHKSHWNFRDAHVRVYDPRGFEFEISVPNLLFILREGSCNPGKGLEGKFVYAWEGTELVLLPCHSEDYKRSQSFTDLQGKQVKAKELVDGATYLTKQQEEYIFIGKMDYHFVLEIERNHYYGYSGYDNYRSRGRKVDTTQEFFPIPKGDEKGFVKKFVFWDVKLNKFVFLNEIKTIASLKDDSAAVHPEYADYVQKYNKSVHGAKVTKLFLKEVDEKKKEHHWNDDTWFYEDVDGSFVEVGNQYSNKYNQSNGTYTKTLEYIKASARYFFDEKTGLFTKKSISLVAYVPDRKESTHYDHKTGRHVVDKSTMEFRQPTTHRLFAQTENGGKFRVSGPGYEHPFHKEK